MLVKAWALRDGRYIHGYRSSSPLVSFFPTSFNTITDGGNWRRRGQSVWRSWSLSPDHEGAPRGEESPVHLTRGCRIQTWRTTWISRQQTHRSCLLRPNDRRRRKRADFDDLSEWRRRWPVQLSIHVGSLRTSSLLEWHASRIVFCFGGFQISPLLAESVRQTRARARWSTSIRWDWRPVELGLQMMATNGGNMGKNPSKTAPTQGHFSCHQSSSPHQSTLVLSLDVFLLWFFKRG